MRIRTVMKTYFIGVLSAVVLALTILAGYELYRTTQYAQASAQYLFAPTDVKDKAGKPLTREQLLDAALADYIKRTNAPDLPEPAR
jgi:predicted negative regulator of RcsB-dependent stress response